MIIPHQTTIQMILMIQIQMMKEAVEVIGHNLAKLMEVDLEITNNKETEIETIIMMEMIMMEIIMIEIIMKALNVINVIMVEDYEEDTTEIKVDKMEGEEVGNA